VRAAGGFTLIEVLVAVVITAVVMSTLFGVYGQTLETSRSVSAASGEDQTARLLLGQIADDLDSLRYVAPKDVRPEAGPGRSGRAGRTARQDVPTEFIGLEPDAKGDSSVLLAFTTASSLTFTGDYPSRRLARVGYVLEKGAAPGLYRVFRTEMPCAQLELPEEGEDRTEVRDKDGVPAGIALGLAAEGRIELADSVRGLFVAYLDERGKAVPAWSSADRERLAKESTGTGTPKDELPKPLPRLVRITLVLAGAGGRDRLFERTVLIPAAL
jgi:prepilin-type N-terminal cleavage/methylation domain-containing protein